MRYACAALFPIVFAGTAAAAASIVYHVDLDERAPLQAMVAIDVPPDPDGALVLRIRPASGSSLTGAPTCGDTPLPARTTASWTVPASCRTLRWRLALRDQDKDGMDAADPSGGWSAGQRWWLLTDHLAFLAPSGGWESAEVDIVARLRDGRVIRTRQPFPHRGQMPFYGVASAMPPRRFQSRDFSLRVYGRIPAEADGAQQQLFADTWSRWRRDILPRNAVAPRTIDMLWVTPPPDAQPNFMASAGLRAVLMQTIPGPDKAASDAKLRAAIVLGAHEGFHTLIGSIPATWPTWVNESWASYFAWRAAEGHLDAAALKAAKELIDAPAEPSLLTIEAQIEHGDGRNYEAFYGKGAHFWAAIDGALTTRRNPSGRLAALIQDTNGLRGLDWSNPDAIAAYFNARSGGKAGPIVRCYLVDTGCG